MKAFALKLWPWFAISFVSAANLDFDTFDGSAFIHRNMHVLTAASSSSPNAASSLSQLAHRLVLKASDRLQNFETKLEAERKELQQLRDYVGKVRKTFGHRGTLFSKLHGLLPAGQSDEADRMIFVRLLGLLKHREFAKVFYTAISDIGRAVAAYTMRTDKRVDDLVLASANTTEQELPQLIKKFFLVQQHIVSGVINKMEYSFQRVLLSLPEDFNFLAGAAGPLLKQLGDTAEARVANETQRIVNSNGTQFCGVLDVMLIQQVLPMVNQTVNFMPMAEIFAEENAEEVSGEVKKIVAKLKDISGSLLTSLKKQANVWTEKVCGLIGVVAAAPSLS
mmetsp:Transcript_7459/g.17677  ORF Transcript_7459/g.17677 Transcript_7459/m.17677 type:complete len:336 (+) Transcript_7459:108-1115(+)|eukprot:CAMPEP_0171098762 /NCGR_PEP_ID=MMETSP0766_2-20121228/49438_1 /TAXON_ID=439317 /ORGANISM="Gambierdiscus australes, Strain CAWD 149" /LENGTH=335 /DNA_ID=CAMNT_0011558203 /DNA_START=82 /DNA_END=1089 /DNA_ORIENTATION=+